MAGNQMENARLHQEVQSLRAKIRSMEEEMKAFQFVTEKTLLEESPVMGALRDCFPTLKLVPPELVQQHAALVKSTDDFDNATYPYFHQASGIVYLFKCSKEHNLFSKDKCVIQMWTLRGKPPAGASRDLPPFAPAVPVPAPPPAHAPPAHHPHPHHPHPHHPHHPSPQGFPPGAYPPGAYPPGAYPAQPGFPPQGGAPSAYPPQGQPPAGYPAQGGAPPAGYPPQGQGYPPGGYPYPPSGQPGYPAYQ